VIERGEVAFGTTGRNHCLLHSGGRYCVTDQESAIECIDENLTLRKIMPDLLELNDGLFVAVTESDLAFKERFLEGCAACHIPAHEITVAHASRTSGPSCHLSGATKNGRSGYSEASPRISRWRTRGLALS
jgi:glycerol-3-phosphate dehydrogenase